MHKKITLLYKALWLTIFKVENYFFSLWFRFLLWLNGVKTGNNIRVHGAAIPTLRISPYSKSVTIGSNVIFNNYNDVGWNSRSSLWVKANAVLSIGNNSGMNGALIYASNEVIIGENVKIGGGSKIFDTNFHSLDYLERRTSNQGTISSPIIIDNDVFIGTGCTILKGVHIGERSIIAAGSVVTTNIPTGEIWGGNPAKYIKKITIQE